MHGFCGTRVQSFDMELCLSCFHYIDKHMTWEYTGVSDYHKGRDIQRG